MASYDPAHGQWGGYASVPLASRPQLHPWDSGQWVGFIQGVLRLKCNQLNVYVAPLWGPWNFDYPTYLAVRNLQAWYGLPVTGEVNAYPGDQTHAAINVAAWA